MTPTDKVGHFGGAGAGVGERKRADASPRREQPKRRRRRSCEMQKPRPWPTFRLRWRRYDKTCTLLARSLEVGRIIWKYLIGGRSSNESGPRTGSGEPR